MLEMCSQIKTARHGLQVEDPALYLHQNVRSTCSSSRRNNISATCTLCIRKWISAAVNLFNSVRGSGFEVKRSLARGPINSTMFVFGIRTHQTLLLFEHQAQVYVLRIYIYIYKGAHDGVRE